MQMRPIYMSKLIFLEKFYMKWYFLYNEQENMLLHSSKFFKMKITKK